MIIEMEPLDVLFFRDSKPFNKGEDNWASSIPFPNLTTLYGMLRSTYFSLHINEFFPDKKENDSTNAIRIESANLVYQDSVYYPIPEDLYCYEAKDGYHFMYKQCVESKDMVSSFNVETGLEHFVKIPNTYHKQKPVSTAFFRFDKENLQAYFMNDENLKHKDFREFIFEEGKIGIGRSDRSKCSEEGLLYRIGQIRYEKDLKIRVKINDGILDLPEKGTLKLGGQGNSVSYKLLKDTESINFCTDRKEKCNRVKLYLKSPAVFQNGWKPDFLEKGKLEGVLDGKKVRLLTACINGYLPIGGYDLEKNCPKPLVKAVPAGSVYLFELLEPAEVVKLKEVTLESNMVDNIYEKCGYGKAICSYYKEEK